MSSSSSSAAPSSSFSAAMPSPTASSSSSSRSCIPHSKICCPRHLCPRLFQGLPFPAMEICSRHSYYYAQERQKQLMHFVRSSCSNAGSLDRAYFLPRSTHMQRNCNHVLLARLAWRLRLHSCAGLSEFRGSSCMLSARRLALRLAPLASPTSPQRTAQQPQPQLGPPASRCCLRPWFRNARRYSQLSEKEKSVTLRMGWRQYLYAHSSVVWLLHSWRSTKAQVHSL